MKKGRRRKTDGVGGVVESVKSKAEILSFTHKFL